MGLLLAGLMAVFILPILIGILMLKKSRKIAIGLISIPFILTVAVVAWWVYEVNDRFVSNTDLANEQIEPFLLFDEPDAETLAAYGTYEEDRGDEVFDRILEYEDFSLGIDRTGELIYIRVTEAGYETMFGIQVGDPIERVEALYGTDTYTTKETGQGIAQNYVDRDHNKHLKFLEEDGRVSQIILYKK